jgi:hypothetical protein
MDTPRESRTNTSTTDLAVRSSRSKGGQKMKTYKSEEREKINKVCEIIKSRRKLRSLNFNLTKIDEGKYISTFKYKDSDPEEIGKVYNDNGELIAEGVITKDSAFYLSLDEGINHIEEFQGKVNIKLVAYLVDVDKIVMKATFIEKGNSETKIWKKGTKKEEAIMTIENRTIKDVKEDPDVIKVFKELNTNEIRKQVESSGRTDFLWYVFVVASKDNKIKKYFQISSYEKKWSNYVHIISNHLYEKTEKIIHDASRFYKEFKDDVDKMKKVEPKLESIMKKDNKVFPEFLVLDKFKEFVNLLFHFCPIEKIVKLVEVIKIVHYICKTYKDSKLQLTFVSRTSVLNIENLLGDQNAEVRYLEYSTNYYQNKAKHLYNEAKEALEKDEAYKNFLDSIRNPNTENKSQ